MSLRLKFEFSFFADKLCSCLKRYWQSWAIYYNLNSKSREFFSVKKKSFLSMNHKLKATFLVKKSQRM